MSAMMKVLQRGEFTSMFQVRLQTPILSSCTHPDFVISFSMCRRLFRKLREDLNDKEKAVRKKQTISAYKKQMKKVEVILPVTVQFSVISCLYSC